MSNHNGGWFKSWRSLEESLVWKDDGLFKLWWYCCSRASRHPKDILWGRRHEPIHLEKGQFVTGRHELHKALYPECTASCHEVTTWRRLLRLQEAGNVHIDSRSQFSIVTVVNYGRYQDRPAENEQPDEQRVHSQMHSECTASEQPDEHTIRSVVRSEEGEEEKPGAENPNSEVPRTPVAEGLEVFRKLDATPSGEDIDLWQVLMECQPTQVARAARQFRQELHALATKFSREEIAEAIRKLPHDAAKPWDLGDALTGAGVKSNGTARKPGDYTPPLYATFPDYAKGTSR